ncbi:MAG: hypothetical protein K6T16_00795 [Candidatus Pacearchaeota archaeon]|nr:hypothetical protein [Candidatus Pacearchaeota archaeon]
MEKKSVVFCLLATLLASTIIFSIIAFALAQEQTEEQKVAKAYNWLISKVRGKWQDLNIKQHVFSLLALSCNSTYADPGRNSLNSKAYIAPDIKCWGQSKKPNSPSECLLTETALAKMALDEFDENTTKVKNWILRQNMTQTQGIDWYLQIDVERGHNATCSVIYGGYDEKLVFGINKDKKVMLLNSSECFKSVYQNYWFVIEKTPACYKYVYNIKCWSDTEVYRASLLYKKTGSDIWHVSSETKSGKPGVPGSGNIEDQPQPLELRVPSYCLANPLNIGYCDYEGTAWSAYALSRQGDKTNANLFVPYLVVFAEENIQYFPESFLYPLTTQTRYSDSIIAAQKIVGLDKGYWLIQPIIYGRVYDTSHAGLALGATSMDAINKAKKYLIGNQETNGDLVASAYGEAGKDAVRDTAFTLWVFWPYLCPGAGGSSRACEDQGPLYRCTDNVTCMPDEVPVEFECAFDEICCKFIGGGEVGCTDAGGMCKETCNIETEFERWDIFCPGLDDKCCKAYEDANCDEAGGELCGFEEECSGTEVYTLDGDCCLGSCIPLGASDQNCIDIGIECDSDEICINKITWSPVNFVITKDTDFCCVGSNVKCVQDKSCSEINGQECDIGEDCVGGTVKETNDVKSCCTGTCLGTCSSQGGTICIGDEECSRAYIEASDTTRCCPAGAKCKKPAGLWWIWIIIIIIVLAGAGALYYFKFRKPGTGAPKEKPELFPSTWTIPPKRPTAPMTTGPSQTPTTRPAIVPRIGPRLMVRPMAKAPVPSQPRPMPSKMPAGTPTATITKAKETTTKEKSESELEKTLKKLKKITKK